MSDLKHMIIIEGITEDGQVFRPANWAERMSGAVATFQKHRIVYSPLLKPIYNQKGYNCVALDPILKKTSPELYRSVMDFAKKNHLRIHTEDNQPISNE